MLASTVPSTAGTPSGSKKVVDVRALSRDELADLALKLNSKLKKHQEAARAARRELRRSESLRQAADRALEQVVGVPLDAILLAPSKEAGPRPGVPQVDERALARRLRQAGRAADAELRSLRANFEAQARSLGDECETQRQRAARLQNETKSLDRER